MKAPREKMTEAEFVKAKRLAKIDAAFPKGFRRFTVRNYERGEFNFRTGVCPAGNEVFGMLCNPSEK